MYVRGKRYIFNLSDQSGDRSLYPKDIDIKMGESLKSCDLKYPDLTQMYRKGQNMGP